MAKHRHMKHHIVLYGPMQKQRPSEHYLDATTDRVAIGNIGLEWIIPSSAILAISLTVLHFFKVTLIDQVISCGTVSAWSFVMFSYLHDRMHIKDFWMESTPVLKHWFLRARRLHDIHHYSLTNTGLMDKNFGIGFFVFDRLFGTLAHSSRSFNRSGYARAQERFHRMNRNKSTSCARS